MSQRYEKDDTCIQGGIKFLRVELFKTGDIIFIIHLMNLINF